MYANCNAPVILSEAAYGEVEGSTHLLSHLQLL